MRVGSLFSGIGGLDLGFQRAGFEIAWQCETDPYCRKVLKKHWPDIIQFGDIRHVGFDYLEWVDVIAGGFPCQPVSLAGKRLGRADERWLWPEFARIVRALQPTYVVVENVPGILSAGIDRVLGDLAESGYDAEWQMLPAAAFGAPHLRNRIFIVAYSESQRWERAGTARDGRDGPENGGPEVAHTAGNGRDLRPELGSDGWSDEAQQARVGSSPVNVADTDSTRLEGRSIYRQSPREWLAGEGGRAYADTWLVEPDVGRVANGVPRRVDRLRGLGNAVVPQVAQYVAECVKAHAERVA